MLCARAAVRGTKFSGLPKAGGVKPPSPPPFPRKSRFPPSGHWEWTLLFTSVFPELAPCGASLPPGDLILALFWGQELPDSKRLVTCIGLAPKIQAELLRPGPLPATAHALSALLVGSEFSTPGCEGTRERGGFGEEFPKK